MYPEDPMSYDMQIGKPHLYSYINSDAFVRMIDHEGTVTTARTYMYIYTHHIHAYILCIIYVFVVYAEQDIEKNRSLGLVCQIGSKFHQFSSNSFRSPPTAEVEASNPLVRMTYSGALDKRELVKHQSMYLVADCAMISKEGEVKVRDDHVLVEIKVRI